MIRPKPLGHGRPTTLQYYKKSTEALIHSSTWFYLTCIQLSHLKIPSDKYFVIAFYTEDTTLPLSPPIKTLKWR